MNLAGASVCLFIMALLLVVLREFLSRKPKKLICQITLLMAFGGAIALFALLIVALLLGHAEERGPWANAMGSCGVVAVIGIGLGQLFGCGSQRNG